VSVQKCDACRDHTSWETFSNGRFKHARCHCRLLDRPIELRKNGGEYFDTTAPADCPKRKAQPKEEAKAAPVTVTAPPANPRVTTTWNGENWVMEWQWEDGP
jgi:hypothetical protein